MMKYAYARCSKDEQKYSIPAQITGIQERYSIDAVYFDHGVSGVTPLANRPAGKDLLDRVKPGDSVIIWKLDRGFRDAADAMAIFKAFKARGISLFLLDISSDDLCNSIVGELVMTIMAGVANFERNRISERTREGLARAKARGVKLGTGHPNNFAANQETKRQAYEWIEQHREILEEFRSQGHNQTKIASLLNLARVPTRNGGKWTQPLVSRTLTRLEATFTQNTQP